MVFGVRAHAPCVIVKVKVLAAADDGRICFDQPRPLEV